MAYLTRDERKNPETGLRAIRFRIVEKVGEKLVSGQIGYLSEAEALRLLRLYERRRAAGESPDEIWQRGSIRAGEQPETQTPPPPRMADLYARHRDHLEADGAAQATRDSARYAWMAWEPEIGSVEAASLTQATVDAVVIGWRRARLSDRTVQIRVLLLKRLLDLGARERLIPAAPPIRVPSVRERRPHRWLDPEQQAALLAVLPWATAEASCWAIWLCLQLGLRIGEATSRRWADIDWRSAQLRIGADGGWQVKTRTERSAPLAPPILAQLRAAYERLPADTRDGQMIAPVADVRHTLETACRRARLPRMTPHSLRHSWASRLATAGVDRPTLMALGGWTSGEMLDEIYAHAHPAHVREQVARTALAVVEMPTLPQSTQAVYPDCLPSPLVPGRRR